MNCREPALVRESFGMIPFDFQCATRIVFGPGSLVQLGTLARELGGRRALVVSDSGIVAAGHADKGMAGLEQAGLAATLFAKVHSNPTTDDVLAGVQVAQAFQPDLLVGLGGGSSMDCAKGINFIFTGGGQMADYWGQGKARGPMLPMIAIPTTAGTGSETQSYALISDAKTHVKMACGDKRAACRVALLDPELTVTQPRTVTADTGIDAIAHAVETFVTRVRSAVSLCYSREAWRLLTSNFIRVLSDPTDLNARGGMQVGASLAGLAIENSMLGATHALANPLTSDYDAVHGEAIGMLLPHVVRFNAEVCDAAYATLLASASEAPGMPRSGGGRALADYLAGLVQQAGLPTRLGAMGVPREALPDLAAQANQQWTAGFNPRPTTPDLLLGVYEAAY